MCSEIEKKKLKSRLVQAYTVKLGFKELFGYHQKVP